MFVIRLLDIAPVDLLKIRIMEENETLKESNFQLLETWSDFVKVSLSNGETMEGIRKRLASNNLTEEEIEFILDPKSRTNFLNAQGAKNGRYRVFGFLKLIIGLFFLMTIEQNPISGLMIGVSSLMLSVYWFSKVRRVSR